MYVAALGAGLAEDGAHLAMALGESPADAETYRKFRARDGAGSLYGWATISAQLLRQDPAGTLQRPEWDTRPYAISMTAARRAQAALMLWHGPGDDPDSAAPPPAAAPDRLTLIAGDDALAALALMGLTPVQDRGAP